MSYKAKTEPVTVSGDGVAIYRPHCPQCGTPIHSQATVDEFGVPSKWAFWGYPGSRFIACKGERDGYMYTHFYAVANGKTDHRLAWVKKQAGTQAEQMKLI